MNNAHICSGHPISNCPSFPSSVLPHLGAHPKNHFHPIAAFSPDFAAYQIMEFGMADRRLLLLLIYLDILNFFSYRTLNARIRIRLRRGRIDTVCSKLVHYEDFTGGSFGFPPFRFNAVAIERRRNASKRSFMTLMIALRLVIVLLLHGFYFIQAFIVKVFSTSHRYTSSKTSRARIFQNGLKHRGRS
jgi:hypothetical protein